MTIPTDPGGALLSAAWLAEVASRHYEFEAKWCDDDGNIVLRERKCHFCDEDWPCDIGALLAQDARWRALVGALVAHLAREQAYAEHMSTCAVCAPPPIGTQGVCEACWPLFSNLGMERQHVMTQAQAALAGEG